MSICDDCIHDDVCGLEDNHEEGIVSCADMIPKDVFDKIRVEIANHLQIMDICDVKKVNGVIVQSELINRKVVLYDSVMQIIDKYRNEVNHEADN